MNNKPVAKALKNVLSDSYALYLKTQNYHWNVEDPNFRSLHSLFEEQYRDLAAAVDVIAESIRGLGEKVPASFEFYMKNGPIAAGNETGAATEMLKELAEDQTKISRTLQKALETAQTAKDEVTAGLMIERLSVHRKAAWMLNSSVS